MLDPFHGGGSVGAGGVDHTNLHVEARISSHHAGNAVDASTSCDVSHVKEDMKAVEEEDEQEPGAPRERDPTLQAFEPKVAARSSSSSSPSVCVRRPVIAAQPSSSSSSSGRPMPTVRVIVLVFVALSIVGATIMWLMGSGSKSVSTTHTAAMTVALCDIAQTSQHRELIMRALRLFEHHADVRGVLAQLRDESEQREQRERERQLVALATMTDMYRIAATMRKYVVVPEIQQRACKRVHDLTLSNDSARRSASTADIIKLVVQVLKKHASNAGVAQAAVGALVNIALNDDNKEKVASTGGVEALLETMRDHAKNVDIVQYACAALAAIAFNADNKLKIGSAGGIEAMVNAMRDHAENVGVVENACRAIAAIAINSDNRMKIADAGGIAAVLKAMHEHSKNARIVEHVCAALAVIAGNDYNRVKVADAGGIRAVIKAMRDHAENANIVQRACAAMGTIAFTDSNQVKIADADGIETVLEAMRKHAKNAVVVQSASWALAHIAIDEDNKAKIGAAGGIEVVLEAMREHANNVTVVEYACWALSNIASSHDANRFRVADNGGIELLLAALDAQSTSADSHNRAISALYVLTLCEALRPRLVQAGVIFALERAQVRFPGDCSSFASLRSLALTKLLMVVVTFH